MIHKMKLASVFVLLSFLGLACSPMQQIYNKEKVINKNTESHKESQAAVRPAQQADHFLPGTAIGKIDFLFVIDNTPSTGHRIQGNDSALDHFHASYLRFLGEKMHGPEAKFLDYRIQVITTPRNRVPENFVTQSIPAQLQLDELFRTRDQSTPYLFSKNDEGRESDGRKTPFLSTSLGLDHPAFVARNHTPLVITYLLGSDNGTASQDPSERKEAFLKSLQDHGRDLYQTQLMILGNNERDQTRTTYCDRYRYPENFFRELNGLTLNSITKNLCEGEEIHFEDDLFTSAVEFKKRYILSRIPYLPATMIVNIPNHLYRFGEDYLFNAQTNEITFLPGREPEAGSPLTVSYFLEPAEDLLPGGTSPSPASPEGSPVPEVSPVPPGTLPSLPPGLPPLPYGAPQR